MQKLIGFGVVLSMLGCVRMPAHERVLANFRKEALTRAAYEAQCPAEQLELEALSYQNSNWTVGVRGCGAQLVYMKTSVQGVSLGWRLNSSKDDSGPR